MSEATQINLLITNEMLKVMSKEVRQTEILSTSMDTTMDISYYDHCAIFLRYIKSNKVLERAIALKH